MRTGTGTNASPAIRILIQSALLAGWRMKATRKGYMLFPPNPANPAVLIHRTPSDYRAIPNAAALIRRFS